MAEKYLYTTNNVVDRMVYGGGRVLRSDTKRAGDVTALADQTKKEVKDLAAVRKLEKEMDLLTHPALLQSAREDQQGLKEGSRSYT
ncbi:hypothetical protein H2200_009307 [Cladophialophora chaetospira]|uniref:Uncharacterized protein n=1 Tax=Cladophialophora chaetospira TaxID=386627 RepID=A0AA38X422_9EURO|nr:hypothetical protein H2200_009307 [Cladophialophora chaetospira]